MARFLKDRHLLHALALTVSRRKQAEEAGQRARKELSRVIDQLEQERTERKQVEEKLLHTAEGWRTTFDIAKDITERKQVEEEIHLLLTLIQSMSEARDFDAALGIVLNRVCEITGWNFGEAWVPSHDGGVLEYSPAWYSSTNSLQEFRKLSEELTFPPNAGLPGRVGSSKKPEWIPDVSIKPEAVFLRAQIALKTGLKAGFGVPIIADSQVLAVLVFFMFESSEEDNRLVELVSAVATQLGSVIQRKRMEEALRESERKYRSLVNNVKLGVFRSTPGATGRFLEVNPAMEEITGYSKEELLQMNVSGLYAHPEEREAILEEIASTEGKATRELCFMKKDGAEITVSDTKVAVRDSAGRILFFDGILADITEYKQMQQKLIITDRLASIGKLAAGVAHEVNNPLTSVIGFSELLLEKAIPEDIRKDIEIISREAQRAAEVVKNLLIFARKHKPSRQPLNINDIIKKVLELRAYEHKVSNIQVNTQFAPDLPAVMADHSQLQQVAFNIIVNAEHSMIEAHNRGTLTITTERAGNIIKVSFADNGSGISKKDLGHLFDPFFTTKEVGEGTGLGLSICHGIVTAHGGRIYVESKLGKGATFVVELPIVTNDGQKGH